jgi:thiopeptide-type bacteriocin biosynthesis protein
MTAGPAWQQLNLTFAGRQAAEHAAAGQLGPALTDAETTGLISSWFFIRKPWWRVRYLPASAATATAAGTFVTRTAQALVDAGHAVRWTPGIYEPETCAFGGPEAMTAAHTLFHADSRHILTYLAGTEADQRRELTLLLCASLMRAAGQDRYEQGDIWAKVCDLRAVMPAATAPSGQREGFTAAVRRLISVDTSPHTEVRSTSLAFADDWLTAFERAGQALQGLTEAGHLTRGIRAICAHHVIFHWNRAGIPGGVQADLARAARQAIFA